jgi:hypothetical protein
MTRPEDRQTLARDIAQACAEGARFAPACALVGIAVRTLRRWQAGDGLTRGDRRPDAPRPVPSPLCQRSCRPDRIGTFGGADIRKWLDTDRRTRIG